MTGARPDSATVDTVVFDVGGVLLDWDPRYLYRKLLDDETEVEQFLATVTTREWNAEQDRGRPVAEATRLLVERHPARAELIEAYYGRHLETLAGQIEGTVAIVDALHAGGIRLYALTNYSAEVFPVARAAYGFFDRFDGIVVSGQERVAKPDHELYRRLLRRYAVDPARAVYVDDVLHNVVAATEVGFADAVHFTTPDALAERLAAHGLPTPSRSELTP